MRQPDELIRRWLEAAKDDYLEDLAALVNRDCGTANIAGVNAVQDWLQDYMHSLGAEVERQPCPPWADALRGRWHGPGTSRLLLSAHADTVYPIGTAAERPLLRDPQSDEHWLGAGVIDMKSGLLAGLYAIAALRALSLDRWGELAMVITPDEERGSSGSKAWLAEIAQHYDAALVLEAGGLLGEVVTGRKGGGIWRISVEGRAAHAGTEPEEGANALVQLAHHLIAADALNGTIERATIVPSMAEGGQVLNTVPPHAFADLDCRGLDEQALVAIDEALRQMVSATQGLVAGTTSRVERIRYQPALPRTEASLKLHAIAQEAGAAQGLTVDEETRGGTSDGNFLASAGLPVLDGLGPSGGLDHSPGEYLVDSSIVPRIAMVAGLVLRLCEA